MDQLTPYASIVRVGHKYATGVFDTAVTVQEKVDGSQFSFGVDHKWELHCRSKGAVVYPDNPPALFKPAVAHVKRLAACKMLDPDFTFRGEAFFRSKHNVLSYNRMPEGGIVLFDIEQEGAHFLHHNQVETMARMLGVEPVRTYGTLVLSGVENLAPFLENESQLGGVQVEGVVAKNYDRFGPDHKPLMVKLVSEAFQEVHGAEWKKMNPGRHDVVETIIKRYATAARFQKAVIHLREQGLIVDGPQDIGLLMREVQDDVEKECKEAIANALYGHFWNKDIKRGITQGLPTWYKEKLNTGAGDDMVIPVPGVEASDG